MGETNIKYYDIGIPMTKQFEGFSPSIYKDSVGKRTIGYGFNIDDKNMASMIPSDVLSGSRPLTTQEADTIFVQRYNQAAKDALNYLGPETMLQLDPERQAIIVDMAYNMGPNTISKFKGLKKAIQEGDYIKAASEMKSSSWYKQVGNRSKHHVLKFSGK